MSMNRKLYGFAVVLITLGSCQCSKPEDSKSVQDTTANNAPGQNSLTAEQKADGWKILFNGQDLEGWRFFRDKENNSWRVIDGTLHCKPFDEANKRSDLITTEQFTDFELVFDWKISPQGNSGVMFRVTEEFEEPYLSGPEYQVLDDEGYPGDVKDVQLTGSNFGMHAPSPMKILKPVGDWNSSRLVVKDNHVEHWLNGAKVIEYEIDSEEWKRLKHTSKWNDVTGYGAATTGHIDIQDHGNEVWYKNIFIKPL